MLASEFLQEVQKQVDLRKRVLALHPICPDCDDPQVQLLNGFDPDTKWRCRRCGHVFYVSLEEQIQDENQ